MKQVEKLIQARVISGFVRCVKEAFALWHIAQCYIPEKGMRDVRFLMYLLLSFEFTGTHFHQFFKKSLQ
jgi:hypothetical protein